MPNPTEPLCNESQFDTFFKQHARILRNYLYYKFGDEADAEDVVQDSFVTLWKNCAKVTMETARGYLFTIANNLSTSIKRHDQVKMKYEQLSAPADRSHESPEFIMLEQEFMDKLNTAISGLPDKQREVFLMNRVEKLTYREIAEVQGVSQKAVEKLMHKALLKLRSKIDHL